MLIFSPLGWLPRSEAKNLSSSRKKQPFENSMWRERARARQ
jgi:hypothetical protein